MSIQKLFSAVDKGNLIRVKECLNEGIDIDSINKEGYTPLLCAICNKNNDLVKLLLKYGANVNGNRETCCYPLEMACLCGNIDSIYLMNQTGRLDYNRKSDCSLIYASSKGFTKIVELLLKKEVDVNKNDGDRPAIHMAVQEDYLDIVELLLDHGADINQMDENSMTPLYIASAENHLDIVKYLISKNAIVDFEKDTTPFIIACAFNNYEVATELLNAGAKIDHKDFDGRTALFYAKVRRRKEMQEFLLSHGASTNIVDNAGISIKDLDNEKIRKKLYRELF